MGAARNRFLRSALFFSFAEKYTLLLLGMGGSMVIARLLTPAEIGLYSVGAVLVGLAQAVRDFGVGPYLTQEKELTMEKMRAALAVSVAVAWLLGLLVLCSSAGVARFYREARLVPVLQLLALNFFVIPFSALTLSSLRRQLRFSALYWINTAHGATQLIVAVCLALCGFGSLSLAWAALLATCAAFLASLLSRPASLPWLPAIRGSRPILVFGVMSTGGGLIDEAGVAAPELIIGKLIGLDAVGLFGKATGLLNLFNQAIASAISPVVFALFSAQARAGHDTRSAYLTTVSYMTVIAWPFFIVLALMALPLLRLLYGDQWDAAAPLVRLMCCSSALYSMFSMARYLFVATGHVTAQARLDATAAPVRIAAVLLAAPFGLTWVAWAVVLGAVVRSWLTGRYLKRLAGLDLSAMLTAVRKSGLVAAATVPAPLAVLWLMPPQPGRWCLPLVAGTGGALLSWLAGVVCFKHDLASELALLRRQVWSLAGGHPDTD
jgi:O-antigen/teichoic acid export membrane protein